MKILAIGFIGAALTLALAAPSWAHTPVMKAPSLTIAGKDTCATRHRHYMTHHHTRGGSGSASDSSANTLNAQELSRLQGGGAPAPAPMPPGR